MANPFDQFDSNPFDQFDQTDTNLGALRNAPPVAGVQYNAPKEKGLGDSALELYQELVGMKSAAQNTMVGLAAFPMGMVSGASDKLINGNKTPLDPLMGEWMKKWGDILNTKNKAPPSADKYNEAIGEAINQVGVPLMGLHGKAPQPYKKVGKAADFDSKLNALGESKVVPKEIPEAGPAAFDKIAESQLSGWQEPLRPEPRSPMEDIVAFTEQQRQQRAQEAIQARQAALELEVKKQAGLDLGAAGRSRQENAPTGYNDWQVGKAAEEAAATHDFVSRAKQMEIDGTPSGERPAQYGFTDTGGRVDQNGIPIRADLSMEAQHLMNPDQMGLWGDELSIKSEQEAANVTPTNRPISVPRSQRGAIDLGPNLQRKRDIISDIVGKKLFADVPDIPTVAATAFAEGKDGKGINSMEAGGTLTAAKRKSALLQGVTRTIQHFKNIAEDGIRSNVFPAEKRLRALPGPELEQLAKVMKEEMFRKATFSMEELANLGLSEKQLTAYAAVRDMYAKSLERENAARVAMGQKPITANEAYLSSRWKGDFRRSIHDAEGKLMWQLAADTKSGLEKQTAALLKQFPDLKRGEDRVVRTVRGSNQDAQSVYTTMLDVLGRDDPAVQKIKEWVEESGVKEGRGMLAQEKHFKQKSNVRGFVGDRPSNTFFGKLDPKKEALALFQEQINYAKNAHKWSAMQEAGQQLKPLFSNEELMVQQPNNMAYAKDYYRDQIGLGTAKAVAALEDAFKGTGISPHAVNEVVGGVKSLWITQKLAASAGFLISNTIQAGNMLPHIADIMVKYPGANPLSAIPLGFSSGLLMAAGHMSNASGKPSFYKGLANLPAEQSRFLTTAMKYAEDNSVTARSIYDESPISSSFSKTQRAAQVLGKTISSPETILRSVTFMTYANLLKSSGKFKSDFDLLRVAEERTNMSMADYREGEKAMLFNKLGTTGNMMNTLQTFPINFYQQWNWAGREAMRGNPLPAAVMFGTQAYVAGAMGIPGFADMDKLWNGIKGLIADANPRMWDKVKDVDLKSMVLDVGGKSALYGGLSNQLDIGVTSRAAAPAGNEMIASPIAPYVDLAKQAGSVASAAFDPMDAQKRAQALMNIAPVGAQGALEVGPLKDQTSVVKPDTGERVYAGTKSLADREGQIIRTPKEETLRSLGLRSQREVMEREQAHKTQEVDKNAARVVAALPNRIYNELRKGDVEEGKALIKLYAELSGKDFTSQQMEAEAIKEYTSRGQKAMMNAKTIEGMKAVKRFNDLMKEQ